MALVLLDVVPDPAYVGVVRLVAVSLARVSGVDENLVEDVRLAVGEACGHAVAAHGRAALDEPVRLSFDSGGSSSGLRVEISDRVPLPEADGADAVAMFVDGPDPAVRPGAGPAVMALLEGLADHVSVKTGANGTTVELRWDDEV